jgi:hypothetical protein
MKAKMLKIAGVKNEKEFYKKFPTEEAFMAKHGGEFKKAMRGKSITKAQMGITAPNPTTFDRMEDYNVAFGDYMNQIASGMGIGSSAANQDIIGDIAGQGLAGTQAGVKKGTINKTDATGYIQPAMDVLQGISMIKGQNEAVKEAKQSMKLSEVMAKAATSAPFDMGRRKYLRPEDVVINPEELYPTYGTGTPAVHAKYGAEIQNTYAPNTLYDNLGYEPLNESTKVKQFQNGGGIDWKAFAQGDGTTLAGSLGELAGTQGRGPSAGSKIGGGLGQAAGMLIGGPVGGMLGKFAGGLIGGLVDGSQRKIENYNKEANRQMASVVGSQVGMNMRSRFAGTMENGGEVDNEYKWMSHTWQPQVITQFGGHKLSDLLKPPADADMLRAGGHLQSYTPPSEKAMQTYAMGGELQTHWGGYAEPVSQNPYLPDGGETVMFRGQSHDSSDGKGNTGIGITYGNNPVEVEGGEPAVKLKDGSSGDSSLVVYGNLKISKNSAAEIGDPKAKGMKFKNYVADLSKKEAKNNKVIEKAIQQLKDIAEKKMNAAAVQNAINDTAEEHGLVADDLAIGKIKKAKTGGKFIAQNGENIVNSPKTGSIAQRHNNPGNIMWPSSKDAVQWITALGGVKGEYNKTAKNYFVKFPDVSSGQKAMKELLFDRGYKNMTVYDAAKRWTGGEPYGTIPKELQGKKLSELSASDRIRVLNAFTQGEDSKTYNWEGVPGGRPSDYTPPLIEEPKKEPLPSELKPLPETTPLVPKAPPVIINQQAQPKNKFDWMALYNQVLPFLRPSDDEALDPMELSGEMYAMSQNQLEPVWAQKLTPRLSTPYDISLQDILNENKATLKRQQGLLGYNPAAQASLAAAEYDANQKVLGEQFRLNQAEKQRVYEQNRNILNQYDTTNMGILDTQYGRQAEALSKTKATTQAALNSISSKIAQNKLENRTLQVYENLYNYRYDPKFRAINMNPLMQWNTQIAGPLTELDKQEKKTAKKGKIIKKNSRNGSIVKAIKNL